MRECCSSAFVCWLACSRCFEISRDSVSPAAIFTEGCVYLFHVPCAHSLILAHHRIASRCIVAQVRPMEHSICTLQSDLIHCPDLCM
ncbi:hypothetical protein B0H13DRAFT_738386 [Mycena leptocephala]|nr:hypothetical protein B0H13DRAFT_738386 [Mycena leptocephala]